MEKTGLETIASSHTSGKSVRATHPMHSGAPPMSKSVKALLEQLARLSIDSRTAVSIWALTEDSPKAVEMTTQLLRKMDSATKHDALEAMTKAVVKYPTPDMIRLRMPEG